MRLSVDYTRSRSWPEALWTGSSTLPRLHQADYNALCRLAGGVVMSVVEQQIDVMLAGIDADAVAARSELRPRIVRIVQAFALTPDELGGGELMDTLVSGRDILASPVNFENLAPLQARTGLLAPMMLP